MARKTPEQPWFKEAIDLMVRHSMSLRQAVAELELPITSLECDRIFKSKTFQDLLWAERNKYNTEVATLPGNSKTSLEGLALILVQKLIDSGDYDKALDGIQKLARLKGWDKAAEVNIFAGLTAKDIEEARKQVESQLGTAPTTSKSSESLPN